MTLLIGWAYNRRMPTIQRTQHPVALCFFWYPTLSNNVLWQTCFLQDSPPQTSAAERPNPFPQQKQKFEWFWKQKLYCKDPVGNGRGSNINFTNPCKNVHPFCTEEMVWNVLESWHLPRKLEAKGGGRKLARQEEGKGSAHVMYVIMETQR